MNDSILEPLRYYETEAKNEHSENVEEYFEKLVDKSGVDVSENRATVKKYKNENEAIKKLDKKIFRYKLLRVLLILMSIIGAILFFVGIADHIIALIPVGIVLVAVSLFLWLGKINRVLKNINSERDVHLNKASELLKEAEKQMAPLNALFDNTDTFNLIEKTMPEFSFDSAYTKEQEENLFNNYDFCAFSEGETTAINTLSGKFCRNPFLYCRYKTREMIKEKYTGHLTISWRESYHDKDGNVRTRTRTQTLTASVTKPKPYYYISTALGYGSQAAPDLSFSRRPSHAENLSDKSLEKKVNSGSKKLQKKTRKEASRSGGFQEMSNAEFDVLFAAKDRNNEVQFRLMYTPLAQKNTTSLIKSKTGYGDDFSFIKRKRYNIIMSEHANSWHMDTSASNYRSYDIDTAKSNFVIFNNEYFKSVFFDFAPLMAIPAYTDEPAFSMSEDASQVNGNYTCYEHEVMANAIGKDAFVHKDSATDAILKTSLVSKKGECDIVDVTAYSYATENRVDLIPVIGGDGRLHSVPVHWVEYIPVSKTTQISVRNLNMSEREFKNSNTQISTKYAFYHGMIAQILK
jgi:hypothetical protein